MTREEAEVLIIRYLDGEVTDEERLQVEQLRSSNQNFADWYAETEVGYRALSGLASQAERQAIPMEAFYQASDRIAAQARERLRRRSEHPFRGAVGEFLKSVVQPVPNLAGAFAAIALWFVAVPLVQLAQMEPEDPVQIARRGDVTRGASDPTELAELRSLMGQHIGDGNYEDALAAFEEFAKTQPGAAIECTREAANLWVTVAGLHQQMGDLNRAGEYLIRAGKCLQGK